MMDPETKAAIDSILGEYKHAKETSKVARESAREALHKKFDVHEKVAVKVAKSSLRFDIHTVPSVKGETAILCINTAKACVVLNTKYTNEVLDIIRGWYSNQNIRWNSTDQVMEFHPSLLSKLKETLQKHYAGVQVLGAQKQVPTTKFDKLMACLDSDDKKRIYSLLARKYHPDMSTGSKDIMTLVNLVFKGGD